MVDALVSIVLEKLTSFLQEKIQREVKLVVDARDELKKLSTTFRTIRAVLDDAEKKQVKDDLVKIWLEELKDVAYDMDDVLDEWSTEILRTQIEEGVDNVRLGKRKVRSLISLFNPVVERRDFGPRIKEIRERLDVIANEKKKYHFIEGTKAKDSERHMTSSLIDASEIFGRNLDHDVIISKLLGESSQQEMGIPIVAIVGMGGLGKTTLAQLVFNDDKVKNHFEKTLWVCVSDPFDKVRIAKAIIEEANEPNPNVIEWQALHRHLSNAVMGKRFLLVLDDVWTEDHTKWEPLKLSLKGGAQGSRIVVTTRKESVAVMMSTTYTHRLGQLSEQYCWSLFSRIAFEGRREEECEKLEKIGREITKKCKGMPLAVKTLGGLMRFKSTKQDWQDVLKSDTWELPEVERDILPALLLSYYDLPSHVKWCFSYCAIFPKDHKIEKDKLIKMWMAQGFLQSTRTRQLEQIGKECFDILVMRSFFQDFEKDDDENITRCKMHDLVHDFAQILTKNECFIMDTNDAELNCSKARHSTVGGNSVDIDPLLPSIYGAKKLRTLQMLGCAFVYANPIDLFNHLTCLRVLELADTFLDTLPKEVEKLVHLRYLDLCKTGFEELPETVCNLYNLQTLKLNDCENLEKLPEGMGRMINLRHLEIQDTYCLSYLPQGIGKLSSLRTLCKFMVGSESGGCKIGELKSLNLLQGYLELCELESVENVNEANDAELKKKEHLSALKLSFQVLHWSNNVRGGVVERMESVLEVLQPHPNLESLKIWFYPGSKFPSWMGNSVLSNLLSLELDNCKNCTQLPALGKLPCLETLKMETMQELKYIGHEFFGIDGDGNGDFERAFPKLKELYIHNMYELEEWDLSVVKNGEIMPCLRVLKLDTCPKLKALPALGKLPSLESLQICRMKEVKHVGVEFLGIKDDGDNDDATKRSGEEFKKVAFPKLKVLTFYQMDELEEWEMTKEDGEIMPCLCALTLTYCQKLKEMPHIFPDTLRVLSIGSLPELTCTSPCLPPLLEKLHLNGNASVYSRSLPFLPNLKSLSIAFSPHSSLPEGLGQLKALQKLEICISESINKMSEELRHLTMLRELNIHNCPILEPRCQKEVGEDWSIISHIPSILINYVKIQSETHSHT